MESILKAIHVIYADWCPHCVPTTVDPIKKAAEEIGVPCLLHDIDASVEQSDELVRSHGDWSEDYLVPQVILEFEEEKFTHILTGYSEGVVYTKKAVENVLRSFLYSVHDLKAHTTPATMNNKIRVDLRRLVETKFSEPGSCSHCEEGAKVSLISGTTDLIARQVCSSGYVSRIITYGDEIDRLSFRAFLSNVLGRVQDVVDEDIRTATRYTWDLGLREDQGRVMREGYWVQNYRRTKDNNPNRMSLHTCSRCNSFFFQPITSETSLCESCRLR